MYSYEDIRLALMGPFAIHDHCIAELEVKNSSRPLNDEENLISTLAGARRELFKCLINASIDHARYTNNVNLNE